MGISWIIRARGLAPSIGAGGTIVVAVLSCLVFVSALLTFKSWPAEGGGSEAGALQIRVPEAKAAGRTQPQPAAAAAAHVTATRAGSRSPAARRARGVVAHPRRPGARARFRSPSPAVSSPRPAVSRPRPSVRDAVAPVTAVKLPQSSRPDPVVVVPKVPKVPAGGAEQTVTSVRGVVDDVTAPVPVPPVVQQPVQQALDTVQGAARTVDGITGPLLP